MLTYLCIGEHVASFFFSSLGADASVQGACSFSRIRSNFSGVTIRAQQFRAFQLFLHLLFEFARLGSFVGLTSVRRRGDARVPGSHSWRDD